jgi:hypothetical protein
MILRLGYDIQFGIPCSVAMVALLNLHPSRAADLRAPDELRVEAWVNLESFSTASGIAALGSSLCRVYSA